MSLPITTTADYTSGTIKISTTRFDATELTEYITEYEAPTIKALLDDLMYIDIRDGSPLHSKYTALIDGVDWTDDEGDTHVLRGLKEVLKRFVYWHFNSDDFIETVIGKARNLNENSDNLSMGTNNQVINRRYNQGVDRYNECMDFVSFYQDLTGTITSDVEAPAGTYTIQTPLTLYLEDGDTVTINGVDYVVGSLVADTSFVITGDAGLTLGTEYTYTPFEDPNLTIISRQWL